MEIKDYKDSLTPEMYDLLESLSRSNELYEKFIDKAEVGLYVADYHTCEILLANQKLADFAGVASAKDLLGRPCWSIFNMNKDGRCPDCPYERLLRSDGTPSEPYVWEVYHEWHDRWSVSYNHACYWKDRLVHAVTFYDNTKNKRMQDNLTGLAFLDQRLHMYNGYRLERDVAEADVKPSLIIFDVVSLQKINDAYGRDIGDHLLKSIRDWMLDQQIPNSTFYRIDGDEFCLSVSGLEPTSLRFLTAKISARFSEPWTFEIDGIRLQVFCNITIGAVHGSFLSGVEPLLNLTERILKAAKQNIRPTIYDEAMNEKFKRRLEMELSLKRCVREGMEGFEVFYQPIANPTTGTWCGLEALCRWNSPELGSVSPILFIPEAERLELIGAIGLWVLETSVRQCKAWGLDKLKVFLLDVNLSAVQFSDEHLAPKIFSVLRACSFPGDKLCLEITESTQFTFTDQSLETINHLRSHGIIMALDDFGTGYSSFHSLQSLPIEVLKIERSFVSNIDSNSFQQYLFHVMADLAHVVDMKLIAEGVEQKEQMDILLKNGADYLQGYLFSKPLPRDELQSCLHRFYEVDDTFQTVRSRDIDLHDLLDTDHYIMTPKLYKTLNQCMNILLNSESTEAAVSQVLETIGRYLEVSRAYLFLFEGDYRCSNTQEWCAEGIEPQKENLQHVQLPQSWLTMLTRSGIVRAANIADLPEDIYEALVPQSIKAVVVLPLWDKERMMGFVGFDDCERYRDWRPEEVLMLHNLCAIITATLNRSILMDEVARRSSMMNAMLDHMDIPICVSEIETGKILFANHCARQAFGSGIESQYCWNIHGESERCANCNIGTLTSMDKDVDYISSRDFINPRDRNRYHLYECLIPWADTQYAHLAYLVPAKDAPSQMRTTIPTDQGRIATTNQHPSFG